MLSKLKSVAQLIPGLLLFLAACGQQPAINRSLTENNASSGIQEKISFQVDTASKKVAVFVGEALFTNYLYPGQIAKPILYPLRTSSGKVLTRGYPLDPRPGERTDHPHHIGHWLNYGSVNGLDFWNNSPGRPADQKHKYGTIYHNGILSVQPEKGLLAVTALWKDYLGNTLMEEQTTFRFSGVDPFRFIDRKTVLKALQDIDFKDNKEGMIAVRVSRALELPVNNAAIFLDGEGQPMKEKTVNNEGVKGDYLSSEGQTGKEVWGTRAKWMLLHSIIEEEPVSITIMDHPDNIGYPAYWHAREYGLFSANPLGQAVFSKGREQLNFKLAAGESVTFNYRIMIHSGSRLTEEQINKYYQQFVR